MSDLDRQARINASRRRFEELKQRHFTEEGRTERITRSLAAVHGDPIISGAIVPAGPNPARNGGYTEVPDKRPSCGYKVEKTIKGADGTDIKRTLPCDSENGLYSVKGTGTHGYPKETPVCERHINDAWKNWRVDSAERMKR